MDENRKLEQLVEALRRRLQAMEKEKQLMLTLMDEVEETLEVASSEIPIELPVRQLIEQKLVGVRAAISEYREQLLKLRSGNPPERT